MVCSQVLGTIQSASVVIINVPLAFAMATSMAFFLYEFIVSVTKSFNDMSFTFCVAYFFTMLAVSSSEWSSTTIISNKCAG